MKSIFYRAARVTSRTHLPGASYGANAYTCWHYRESNQLLAHKKPAYHGQVSLVQPYILTSSILNSSKKFL